MSAQALGRIEVAQKTKAQIAAEVEAAHEVVTPAPAPEKRAPSSERIGRAWRVSDDALWNPFEVVSFVLWIVLGFGYLLGRDNFIFAAELFSPVIVIGAVVVLGQAMLRWKSGEAGVLDVLRERMGW